MTLRINHLSVLFIVCFLGLMVSGPAWSAAALWVHNVTPDTGYNRLVIPDINGDGHDELLLYEDYEQLRVISGVDGTTELWSDALSAEPLRYRRGLAIVNDLDGDNVKDIIVIAGTSGNGYDENNGDDDVYAVSGAVIPPGGRVLWGGSALNLGYGASGPVILADIDSDGYDDIFLNTITPEISTALRGDYGFLISGRNGSVIWNYMYNPSTPASSESGIWDVYGKTASPDLDGDGLDDIVVCGAGGSGGIEAWKGGPTAANIWRGLSGIELVTPAVVGDANLDGVADIAVGRFHTGTCPASPDPRLYVLNGQTGTVLWQYGLERTPSSIESLGDANGDSIEDVVIGTALINNCGSSDSSVYAFDGFAGADDRVLWTYALTDQNSYVTVVEDADGDGVKDVAVAGQMGSLLLLSGVDGSVLDQESFPSGSGTVQSGEFNNAAGGDMLTSAGNSVYALSFTGALGNEPPATPALLSPADEAVFGDSTSIKLKSSAFSDPEGDAQTGVTWTLVRADSEAPVGSFPVTFTQGPYANEYQIPDQLSDGLKYTWQVGHKDEQGREVWSEERSFKIGTSGLESMPAVSAGKSLGDFGMVSIVHWPDNPAPKAVFNINYDPSNYRIGAWDPEQNRYIEFDQGLEMEPGRAVWILTRDSLEVNFNGVPVSMTESMEVCLHTHPSTKTGWNMIAPPNAANYLWNQVMVGRWLGPGDNRNVDPVPVSNPVADTLINHRIWEWKEGEYVNHRLDENFVLEHYKGYWVKAIVDGAYLVFPDYAQVVGLSTPRNTMLAYRGKTVQWIRRMMPNTREAIADTDSPPMPMEVLAGNTEPVFEGCFIGSAGSGERSVR
jgi:hypothetical protein